MEGERRGGQGRTHEHDEAVPVGRAALELDHLLVWGAQRAQEAARPAQPGAQRAQVGLAATKAHAAAEASCKGGNAQDVTSRQERSLLPHLLEPAVTAVSKC